MKPRGSKCAASESRVFLGQSPSWSEAILRELGKPASLMRHVQDRPGHVRRHAVDSMKVRTRLGWAPEKTFEVGLKETIEWYRASPWWWKPIKKGEFRGYYEVQYRGQA